MNTAAKFKFDRRHRTAAYMSRARPYCTHARCCILISVRVSADSLFGGGR